ncbi:MULTISPECIES: hypothetical protein [unclassified Actinopolyspora]|uniref:hypothetical protein n=1 Tax=unclassified Actinopolyspora TaxID=2639451 RepID=UPI0013F5DCF8|nr:MULTISPECIES: hypothetical protein [unclassified Actinopolyspora]NHD18441.1 hypothetical protein [Actinopolyspora sp. BKK2]NHE77600.1 hypothetical protein [Actinopolyspora sp. BKK1]
MLSGSAESKMVSLWETAAGTVETVSLEQRPQVFALLERTGPDTGELELFAWGVEVGGSANVFRSDGHVLAHCGSAADAQHMFALIRDVVLAWPEETNRIE